MGIKWEWYDDRIVCMYGVVFVSPDLFYVGRVE